MAKDGDIRIWGSRDFEGRTSMLRPVQTSFKIRKSNLSVSAHYSVPATSPNKKPHKPTTRRPSIRSETDSLSAHSLSAHSTHQTPQNKSIMASLAPQKFFRITLLRSAIGLPKKTSGVLAALGLHRRLKTVYHPVGPDVAGQVFAVKELVDVQEVDQALTQKELRELRRPDSGFWVEKRRGANAA